jgi:murein DD-endopeptidase MepM/ murein hydrolase activator NlpD
VTSSNPARGAPRLSPRSPLLIRSAVAALCVGAAGMAAAQSTAGESAKGLPDGNFPVRAKHQYWDGWGAGRGHKGQDIGARCGARVEVAQTGRLVERDREPGWGNYAVVNVRGANKANLYAHLLRKAVPKQGDRVKAGERLGKVGRSGSATACHLHFEYWRGGWPDGRASRKVTRVLRHWDRNS